MKAVILGSDSKGNCIVIETGNGAIMIDCGLSARKVTSLLPLYGSDISNVRGILVTHGHGDHASGVAQVLAKTDASLYCSPDTAEVIGVPVSDVDEHDYGFSFPKLGGHAFRSFLVPHDKCDCWGFVLGFHRPDNSVHRVGYCTDAGYVTRHMAESLSGVETLFVEANHDPKMLEECAKHPSVKYRTRGCHGHLSNTDAAQLCCHLTERGLKTVVLCHLSHDANTPETAARAIRALNPGLEIKVAQPGMTIDL